MPWDRSVPWQVRSYVAFIVRRVEKEESFLFVPKSKGFGEGGQGGIWKKQSESLNTMAPPLMDKDTILALLTIFSGMAYCL